MHFLRSAAAYSFLTLLIVGIVFPSDSNHGFLAPKSLVFLGSIFFFALYFMSLKSVKKNHVLAITSLLTSVTFLGIWYLVGIDQSSQFSFSKFDQFKVFLPTLFVPIAGWCFVKEGILSTSRIFKTLIYSNFAYSLVKISLMTLHVLGAINLWSFIERTGLRFMSMPIAGQIGRIQTSVDIATPFLVYFALQSHFSRRFQWVYCLISALSVFLSFSRFLMFAFAASILLHIFTLKWRSQIKLGLTVVIICLAGIGVAGPEKVADVIDKRFFSRENTLSDRTRKGQIDALMDASCNTPFLGNGLGGYTTECIRDYTLPHAYEVQWAAFMMQFGLIGLLFLLLPVGYISCRFLRPPLSRRQAGYFLLFGLWLLSGFTNPFLISLTSGTIYLIFLLAGENSHVKQLDNTYSHA
jgi:hypothetical protein